MNNGVYEIVPVRYQEKKTLQSWLGASALKTDLGFFINIHL